MGLSAFNRMRAIAAQSQEGAIASPDDITETLPPDSNEEEDKSATGSEGVADLSAALKLINSAQQPADLSPLPGIGKGAGRIILNKRPESGYGAIAQIQELCPELSEAPFRIDWAAVEVWEAK